MEINLVTISKLTSEIIDKDVIKIEHVDCPVLSDLTNNIYDKYPALCQTDYRLFWEYARNVYFTIDDYISYLAAIRLMLNRTIYILIDDFVDYWEDNISYLETLDRIEEEERIERETDIYDVKIIKKKDLEDINTEDSSIIVGSFTSSTGRTTRNDSDIINYAIKQQTKPLYYTVDMLQKLNLVEDLKKGYPKFRTELHVIPDVVFEKRAPKERKGEKNKKDKKGKDKKAGKKGGKKK